MNTWEEEVIKKLENLDEVPNRNPLKVQSHKQNFMRNAQMIKADLIDSSPKQSWWNQLFQKKEFAHMKIITIFAILGLLFGGGVTAVAAQDSLPGDLLYPVKTLVEDIELGLATDPETQYKHSYDQLNTRFEEIQLLIESGEMPPEPFFYDMFETVEATMNYALQTEDPIGNLQTIQAMVHEQSRFAGEKPDEPIMQQFQNAMKFQQGLLEAGITEPENLANELEYMFQYRLSQEETGEVWQNLYQEQMQHQNAGEDNTFKYNWMFLRSEINDMDEQFQNGQSEDQGQQNSFNDHPNGGNQGDNENGNNGGQGGNGSGGK
jgi:hypothetical protein